MNIVKKVLNLPALFTCCIDCGDRYLGCHGKCEKYLSDKSKLENRKAEHKKIRDADQYAIDEAVKTINASIKRKQGLITRKRATK